MAYVGMYRTNSGRNYFKWSFEKQPNGDVRAYILSQPSYGGRSTGGHSTHVYGVGNRRYICYEPNPDNLDDAIRVAKAWAENTERYIDTGQGF